MRAILLVLLLCVAACAQNVPGLGRAVDVLSHQRPGHGPNGPAIGDYGGLVSRPGGAPVVYRGVPVLQACDLLTPEDIPDLGLVISGGTAAGMVGRNGIEGTGDVGQYYVGSSDAPNSCGYSIAERGLVSLAVHQPVYAGQGELDAEIARSFGPPVERAGVSVYEPTEPFGDLTRRWLRYEDLHVDYVVDVPVELEPVLLDHVIQRLVDIGTAPTGPRTYDYVSPAFTAEFVDGCSLGSWSDVGDLAGGRGASARVEENLSPGVGLIRFYDGLQSNYIHHSCRWRAGDGDFLNAPALTVRTRSYDAAGAPAAALAFERGMGGKDTPVLIGDESLVTGRPGDVWVQFRRGSVVVEVEYSAGDENPPADPVDALLPIARAVEARLPR